MKSIQIYDEKRILIIIGTVALIKFIVTTYYMAGKLKVRLTKKYVELNKSSSLKNTALYFSILLRRSIKIDPETGITHTQTIVLTYT